MIIEWADNNDINVGVHFVVRDDEDLAVWHVLEASERVLQFTGLTLDVWINNVHYNLFAVGTSLNREYN